MIYTHHIGVIRLWCCTCVVQTSKYFAMYHFDVTNPKLACSAIAFMKPAIQQVSMPLAEQVESGWDAECPHNSKQIVFVHFSQCIWCAEHQLSCPPDTRIAHLQCSVFMIMFSDYMTCSHSCLLVIPCHSYEAFHISTETQTRADELIQLKHWPFSWRCWHPKC